MDVKLDSLIEKIRKEGIEQAQQQADEILKEAKQKAAAIVEQAKKEAEKIVSDGKKQVDQYQAMAEIDLKQSARNFELLLKEKIQALFDRVFKQQVATTLTPDFLKAMILKIIENWAKNGAVEVVVSEQDKDQLEAVLFHGIHDELKKSIQLRVSSDVANGFRIGLKDNQVYYDFSDETIAEVLKSLINPKLKTILEQ